MPQEQPEALNTLEVSNFLKEKGEEKRTVDRQGTDLVRTFRDETGLSIRENIFTSGAYDGGIGGSLVIKNGDTVVYEEKGARVTVNEPGEWRGHIKNLIEGGADPQK